MARIAVLGEGIDAEAYALAGAVVLAADDPTAVRAAWSNLAPDVAIVILTKAAAEAIDGIPAGAGGVLTVVMP